MSEILRGLASASVRAGESAFLSCDRLITCRRIRCATPRQIWAHADSRGARPMNVSIGKRPSVAELRHKSMWRDDIWTDPRGAALGKLPKMASCRCTADIEPAPDGNLALQTQIGMGIRLPRGCRRPAPSM